MVIGNQMIKTKKKDMFSCPNPVSYVQDLGPIAPKNITVRVIHFLHQDEHNA